MVRSWLSVCSYPDSGNHTLWKMVDRHMDSLSRDTPLLFSLLGTFTSATSPTSGHWKIKGFEAGETASLPEELSSIPSAHVVAHSHL